jgi:hypothetical protein
LGKSLPHGSPFARNILIATAANHRGATYKEFKAKGFIELVFCAVLSSTQVSGYGSLLMAHLKVCTMSDRLFQSTCSLTDNAQDYVRAKSGIQQVLTYADDTAIGYFKQQGFTKKITLEESKWSGFVKSYHAATFMQCPLLPRIRYVNEARLLALQKDAIHKVMENHTMPRVVHPPPAAFSNGPTRIDPKSIPAIGKFFPVTWLFPCSHAFPALSLFNFCASHCSTLLTIRCIYLQWRLAGPPRWMSCRVSRKETTTTSRC